MECVVLGTVLILVGLSVSFFVPDVYAIAAWDRRYNTR